MLFVVTHYSMFTVAAYFIISRSFIAVPRIASISVLPATAAGGRHNNIPYHCYVRCYRIPEPDCAHFVRFKFQPFSQYCYFTKPLVSHLCSTAQHSTDSRCLLTLSFVLTTHHTSKRTSGGDCFYQCAAVKPNTRYYSFSQSVSESLGQMVG